jgi:very-short-patch-repair endonuclease
MINNELEIIKSAYEKGLSIRKISDISESLLGRKLSRSRVAQLLKLSNFTPRKEAWNKGLTRQTDTTGYFDKKDKTYSNNKHLHVNYGKKLSEESKRKISIARKEYLKNNPDKVGYKINHSSKESYPEKYFNEVFKNRGLNLERYYRVGLFELDFCCPQSKIDIEIDGGTHHLPEVIEKDKRRDDILKSLGWKVIRIDWSHYKMLSIDSKKAILDEVCRYFSTTS